MSLAITQNEAGWSNAAADFISLVEPDASWPEQFHAEAAALRITLAALGDVRLEHFGSTAVPHLCAKPIIDILLIHPDPSYWSQFVKPLEALGYVYWAENPRKDQMFFVKGMPPFGERRTHHLHVHIPQEAQRELLFRDLLRADPALANEYERLKQHLAERYQTDRDGYTNGKTPFISNVLSRRSA